MKTFYKGDKVILTGTDNANGHLFGCEFEVVRGNSSMDIFAAKLTHAAGSYLAGHCFTFHNTGAKDYYVESTRYNKIKYFENRLKIMNEDSTKRYALVKELNRLKVMKEVDDSMMNTFAEKIFVICV